MKTLLVKQIREITKIRDEIPHKDGVYKWWCDLNLLKAFLDKLDLPHGCISDIERCDEKAVLIHTPDGSIQTMTIHNYYCIYVGDTKDLRSRIVNNHLCGNINSSTLRQTIAAVFLEEKNEKKISEIEDKMVLDIYYAPDFACDYHTFQNEEINSHFRILNNRDIFPDNPLYSEDRHYHLTGKGNSKKSSVITEKRKKL